jgi:hypothetical protein
MSRVLAFDQKCFLRSLAKVVNADQLRSFIRRSPDHHHYKWSYLDALLQPLESNQFPRTRLRDLNFALGNLLVQSQRDSAFKSQNRLYLASLYLYINQVKPSGIQLTEAAVRLALESLIPTGDRKLLEMFGQFLRWLIDPNVVHRDAESFFVRLGIVIIKGEVSRVDEAELAEIAAQLPSWVGGLAEIRLLSDDPNFPQSWRRLLGTIKARERVEHLLGLR